MPLTKIWASILAVMATGFLAGMFLLSLGTSGGFTDADRAAIRAATEAGLAALEAEIRSSPVQRAVHLPNDPRLKDALVRPLPKPGDSIDPDRPPLPQVLPQVAEENLLSEHPQMTVGIVDEAGQIVAANGIAEPLLTEAVGSPGYRRISADEAHSFSAALGGRLHVVQVSAPLAQRMRLLAIQPVSTGAGSIVRRVLGSQNAAGLIAGGRLMGEVIGDLKVERELEHLAEVATQPPHEGASDVTIVGEGLDARLGAIGRVPGPAGVGPEGVMLAVLSRNTAAAGHRDLATALREALDREMLSQINWVLLGGLLVVSVGLAFYLPNLEASNPLRRLQTEFQAIAQGTQHYVFHDRYSGVIGGLAKSAAMALEAVRSAVMEDTDATTAPSDIESAPRRTTRSQRVAPRQPRRTASIRVHMTGENSVAAIELPAGSSSTKHPVVASPAPKAADSVSAARSGGWSASTPDIESPEAAAAISAVMTPPPSAAASPAVVPTAPEEPAEETTEENAYFREIFQEFVQVKIACGESVEGFTYEKFASKLQRNTDDLMQRPGVRDVAFTVYVKDGKAALKAKVVKE